MRKLNSPIIMHINYFEQGQSIDYTVRRAVELGFDGIEFRRKRVKVEETVTEYLDEIKRCAEQYGLRYVLFGGPAINVMTQDQAVIRREIDEYKNFLTEADKRFALTCINFMTGTLRCADAAGYEYERHGSGCAEDWHWETAAAACREIADFAPQVNFAFETHMNYIHDLATSTRRLVDLIDRDNFGVNLDFGNSVYFAKGSFPTLEESIAVCGDKLFYTHMKNSIPGTPRRTPTALSQGDINHRIYVDKLCEIGFKGMIGIEAPRPGDREYFAEEDLTYIRSVLNVR